MGKPAELKPLHLSDFDYELPPELIAQQPVTDRPNARLLVVHRGSGKLEHRRFADLEEYLGASDRLVLNDTRVLKARLFGKKITGGKVEVLLHKKISACEWEALLKPGGRVREQTRLLFEKDGDHVGAEVLDGSRQDSGLRHLRFDHHPDLDAVLDRIGHVPLPPYIDRPDAEIDRELYQTVYASKPGAVASPTAGLHFDRAMLERIAKKTAGISYLTLHVGYGTFQPVAAEKIEEHRMHPESTDVSEATAAEITKALAGGRRIVACGTTVVRTLESHAERENGRAVLRAGKKETDMFIYPPYEFKITGAMITNFHLPRTTLLMLISAFAGRELVFEAYREAVKEKYRFYSYGDAMLIL